MNVQNLNQKLKLSEELLGGRASTIGNEINSPSSTSTTKKSLESDILVGFSIAYLTQADVYLKHLKALSSKLNTSSLRSSISFPTVALENSPTPSWLSSTNDCTPPGIRDGVSSVSTQRVITSEINRVKDVCTQVRASLISDPNSFIRRILNQIRKCMQTIDETKGAEMSQTVAHDILHEYIFSSTDTECHDTYFNFVFTGKAGSGKTRFAYALQRLCNILFFFHGTLENDVYPTEETILNQFIGDLLPTRLQKNSSSSSKRTTAHRRNISTKDYIVPRSHQYGGHTDGSLTRPCASLFCIYNLSNEGLKRSQTMYTRTTIKETKIRNCPCISDRDALLAVLASEQQPRAPQPMQRNEEGADGPSELFSSADDLEIAKALVSREVEWDASRVISEGITPIFMEHLFHMSIMDESYGILNESGSSNSGGGGSSRISNQLIKLMDQYKGVCGVILIAYEQTGDYSIENTNMGFKRRIHRFLRFPDFTPEIAFDILVGMFVKRGYIMNQDTLTVLKTAVKTLHEHTFFENVNGTMVKTFYRQIVIEKEYREATTPDDQKQFLLLTEITPDDVLHGNAAIMQDRGITSIVVSDLDKPTQVHQPTRFPPDLLPKEPYIAAHQNGGGDVNVHPPESGTTLQSKKAPSSKKKSTTTKK